MDKWVIASILYVAVVIGGFTVYEEFFADETQAVSAAKYESNENHSVSKEKHEDVENHAKKTGSSHEHGSDSAHKETSEVNVFVQSNTDEIKIFLKDKTGNPVNDLEVNHEKLLHLIIVDEHLQKYYHVHPERGIKG
ncbi:hypothetical protein [Aneurinibacillus tyrosinisolvens]|uniref:hypothetical protein n=1 Tax=Aneurinibacillus tyrosinisolvens TaxID=1443435 RepID=UPI000B271D3F|nr:hypothetical protein [Aneurinibacillus tyrosinisolvens]